MEILISTLHIIYPIYIVLAAFDLLVSREDKMHDNFFLLGENKKSFWLYFIDHHLWSIGTTAVVFLTVLICRIIGLIP